MYSVFLVWMQQLVWQHQKGVEEYQALALLPAPLCAEFAHAAHARWLGALPVFAGVPTALLRRLAVRLRPQAYAAGALLVMHDESVCDALLLREGTAEGVSPFSCFKHVAVQQSHAAITLFSASVSPFCQ